MTTLRVAGEAGGCQEAQEGPRGSVGVHTYPDCGEPLMVKFIAAWGKRSQRSG